MRPTTKPLTLAVTANQKQPDLGPSWHTVISPGQSKSVVQLAHCHQSRPKSVVQLAHCHQSRPKSVSCPAGTLSSVQAKVSCPAGTLSSVQAKVSQLSSWHTAISPDQSQSVVQLAHCHQSRPKSVSCLCEAAHRVLPATLSPRHTLLLW